MVGLRNTRNIAFVGNYLPRACGIATFTHDLAEAVGETSDNPVYVVAINDTDRGYEYPARVTRTIRQDLCADYVDAADYLDSTGVGAVSIQHEFGIFGGERGAYILALMRRLRRPAVVTCHTVPAEPLAAEKEALSEIASRAARLVVMNRSAVDLLEGLYGADREKIAHIQHGIHDVPFVDPPEHKTELGIRGRVLLTFGLLSRGKGIEYVIDAMPDILERHPDTTYVVLGTTHPVILRTEGESYRESLQGRAARLGVRNRVIFLDRFVHLSELLRLMAETDIFVAPYVNLDHTTSGTLAYALGTGNAAVATPFLDARELLAEGRGRLVPVCDSKALAMEINDLLADEDAMRSMRQRAYLYTRPMVWSRIARQYLGLFDEVAVAGRPLQEVAAREVAGVHRPAVS
jgi:glycosyltransferase involved in cell wall biosynthesis